MFCCIEFQENLRQNLIKNDLLFLHFDFSVFRFFFALFSICFLSPSHIFIFLPDKIRIVEKIIKFRIYCVFFVICRRFNIFFVIKFVKCVQTLTQNYIKSTIEFKINAWWATNQSQE